MVEPSLHSGRSTQDLKLIEIDPMSAAAWESMLAKVRGQNDPLSTKSLEVIIEGLKKIEEINTAAKQNDTPLLRIAPLAKSMFTRLARAYNSPTLLKEVGLIYLRDLGQPNVALQHFERSIRLGGPEKELRPLSEAAAVAVQRQMSQLTGVQPGHAGITASNHAKPVATEIIRKTGKVLMPSRVSVAATVRIAPVNVGAALPLPDTTQECLDQAMVAIRQGELTRAEALLRKANEKPAGKSEMWQLWTDLGQSGFDAGQAALVERAFVEALRYDPDELASQFNAALGYQLNHKFDLALETYLKANKIDPKHPKVWCNLGVLYFQTDQYPQAESALRFATMASPDYARAWDNLAAALGAQEKLDEALVACKRAVELRPEYPEAFFKMGVIYFTRGDFAQAAAQFENAAQLPAIAAYCDAFQAIIHARREQPAEAEAAIRRAIKSDSKCDLLWLAWNEIGLAWHAAGDFTKAAAAYGEATMAVPSEPQAWFNLGVSYHKLGDLEAARNSYQHAVDLKESFPGAWHNLGIVCAEKGDQAAAVNAFKREVQWVPDNIRAWYDLGVTLKKLGKEDEAHVAFHKVDLLTAAASATPETSLENMGVVEPKTGPIAVKQKPAPQGGLSIVRWAIAILFLYSAMLGARADEPRGPVATTSGPKFCAQVEKATFLLVNQYRKAHDLPMLTWNDAAAIEARQHSRDMAGGDIDFGHDGFRGRVDHLQGGGEKIIGAGENVFMTDNPVDVAQSAVTGWLHSPHHLKNIRGDFNLSGLGVAQDKNGTIYFTQLFVKTAPTQPAAASANTAPAVETPFGFLATPTASKTR